MNIVTSLILLLVFLCAGFLVAKKGLITYNNVFKKIFTIFLYLLLFSMGLRLGQSREVVSRLSVVGIIALLGTVSASIGTIFAHMLATPLYRYLDSKHGISIIPPIVATVRQPIALSHFKKPLLLLTLVLLGTFSGVLIPPVLLISNGTIGTVFLYILLFIIGIQMASGEHDFVALLLNPLNFVIPAVTLVGTLIGSLALAGFPGFTIGRALALGSGFGWYSLSGVLITDLGEPILGAAAFLANLLREMLSFLLIPLFRTTGRCESSIGLCGATSMDVTLPVLENTWGATIIPLAIAHGVVLSFLVPILVPLFMSF